MNSPNVLSSLVLFLTLSLMANIIMWAYIMYLKERYKIRPKKHWLKKKFIELSLRVSYPMLFNEANYKWHNYRLTYIPTSWELSWGDVGSLDFEIFANPLESEVIGRYWARLAAKLGEGNNKAQKDEKLRRLLGVPQIKLTQDNVK